nr:DUF29 family protein [Gloeobacter morelensis]
MLENPSLQPYLEEVVPKAYRKGLNLAVQETNLAYTVFPVVCPHSLEQMLSNELLSIENG